MPLRTRLSRRRGNIVAAVVIALIAASFSGVLIGLVVKSSLVAGASMVAMASLMFGVLPGCTIDFKHEDHS